ncbi:MAG: Septum formation protein Maf [Alphaproteobacteria bacterium MarineAlpha9_Bin7]|nr:MAG: Septum formation protein Maf [Alphaproteobacteria bacterium MarineAlpha9_Bin7]
MIIANDYRQKLPVVLASASATRAAVLKGAGVGFSIHAAQIDEDSVKHSMHSANRSALDTAQALSDLKASQVSLGYPEALVIGGDQMLVCSDTWFDKPRDLATAREQLCLLRGRAHELLTAISVARGGAVIWRFSVTSELVMRCFSDEFLDRYVESEREHACNSIGGYRLEGLGVQLFSKINGEYYDILGMPLISLLNFLREHGAIEE